MKQEINDDFLLLESDLLFESSAIFTLLQDERKDLILASDFTQSGDEVYLEINKDSTLNNLSKDKTKLEHCDAELVGISKISLETLHNLDFTSALEYEYLLKNIPVKKVDSLIWCEIDCKEHLDRAVHSIIPKLQAKGEWV